MLLFYINKIMHLISFDASPKQLSKLRNGHKVRIKRGTGFNLVVHPNNYHLVSRAFARNKGVDINLSQEEIEQNKGLSPEQHEALGESMDNELFKQVPFAEGGSIFKKGKKAAHSKAGKDIRKSLKPAGRAFLEAGKEAAHQKLAEAHMYAAEHAGDDPNIHHGLNLLAQQGHETVHNVGRKQHGGALFKFLGSKKAKEVRKALKPAGRAFYNAGQDMLHDQLAQMQMQGAQYLPENENAQMGYNMLGQLGHDTIGYNRYSPQYNPNPYYGYGIGKSKIQPHDIGIDNRIHGSVNVGDFTNIMHPNARGNKVDIEKQISQAYKRSRKNARAETGYIPNLKGTGLGAGIDTHNALRMANLASANANYQLAKMHNATVHGQQASPPIKRYYNDDMAPISRGTGLHNQMNLIRGRGSALQSDNILPPALQSQPYGANWHMQFFLPPQYHKYNDGTDVEGRGLYL